MSLRLASDDPEPAAARRLRDGIVLVSRASAFVMGPSITGILREILDALRVRACLRSGAFGALAYIEMTAADPTERWDGTPPRRRNRLVHLGPRRVLRILHPPPTSRVDHSNDGKSWTVSRSQLLSTALCQADILSGYFKILD